jgi:hypothetical protein
LTPATESVYRVAMGLMDLGHGRLEFFLEIKRRKVIDVMALLSIFNILLAIIQRWSS